MSNLKNLDQSYTVEKGSTLWSVAKKICSKNQNAGIQVSNADIIREMKSLATLNNCADFEELGKRFNTTGNTIKIANDTPKSETFKGGAHSIKTDSISAKIADDAPKSEVFKGGVRSIKVDSTSAKIADSTNNVIRDIRYPELQQGILMKQINAIADNKAKIIEYNKLNHIKRNYILVDKKDCKATVYSPLGKPLKSFEVGLGKEIGDDLNDGFAYLGEAHKRTPAGEYSIITKKPKLKDEYGNVLFSLGSKGNLSTKVKSTVALHQIPTSLKKERIDKFNDGILSNNRMSYGCVNFKEKDFAELTNFMGQGSKVYILPEEQNNSLKLALNKQGKLEFEQTKYLRSS